MEEEGRGVGGDPRRRSLLQGGWSLLLREERQRSAHLSLGADIEMRTFDCNVFGHVKRAVLPADSVLRIASAWSLHLMEGGDAVTWSEFGDVFAHGIYESGNIITLVDDFIFFFEDTA